MQCSYCSAEVEGEGSFCDECGKPLREDSAAGRTSGTLGLAAKPATTPVTAQVRPPPFPADPRPFPRAKYNKKWNNTNTAISHWNELIRGLDVSSNRLLSGRPDFNREPPRSRRGSGVGADSGRGVFSAKREYLRVVRKDLLFDICAAPFGDGFFVSTWLSPNPPAGGDCFWPSPSSDSYISNG